MYRMSIPVQRVPEKHARPRSPRFSGARGAELYFTVLTIVILGIIVVIGACVINFLIPAWQQFQSQQWQKFHLLWNPGDPYNHESRRLSPDLK